VELPGLRVTITHGAPSSLHPLSDQPSNISRRVEPPDHILLRVDEPGTGAWNMAVDEALMDFARSGTVTLRFYTWQPHCLSLGRNQRTGRDSLAAGDERRTGRSSLPGAPDLRPGEEVVRRPTGGRSVFHGPELTYCLTAPDRVWGGPRAIYRRVNRAIRRGLVSLGAAIDSPDADLSPSQRGEGAPPPPVPLGPDGCFRDPAPGEVIARGRKLVGSAQWRHAGAILQHGSILLDNRQEHGTLEGVDLEAGRAAIGLADLLPRLPGAEELVATLRTAFEVEFDLAATPVGLDEDLIESARLLETKYRSAEWTWRR
jgi:lipoate-protein ligase A